MEAIITFEKKILLEYDIASSSFQISEDDGNAYPYEFYEDIELCGRKFDLIYLEDLEMIPTSSFDKWLTLDKAIAFLDEKGHESYVKVLNDLKNKDIL